MPPPTRLAAWLLFALAAVARAEGDAPTPTAPPPAALEVLERVYDGGKIDRGTVLKHTFSLKNSGTSELSIDAKPG